MKSVAGAVLALGATAGLIGVVVVASALSVLGVGSAAPSATSADTSTIPLAILALYQQAAATCPGLPWTLLAAVGTVESDNGQSTLPGVHSGANAAGAEGVMQFEPSPFSMGHMSRARSERGRPG